MTTKRALWREAVRTRTLAALPGEITYLSNKVGLTEEPLRQYLLAMIKDRLVMREKMLTGNGGWTWRYLKYDARRVDLLAVPEKMGRKDRDPHRPRCPSCDCGQLGKRAATYVCSLCRAEFPHAEAVTDAQRQGARKAKRAGSGVIAGRVYASGFRWGASWF